MREPCVLNMWRLPQAAAIAIAALGAGAFSHARPQTAPSIVSTAGEGVEASLLDVALETRLGRVLVLDEQSVVFIDERGRRREVRSADLLAILPFPHPVDLERSADGHSVIVRTAQEDAQGEAQFQPTPGLLQLTDNQRYTGDLMPPASGASEDRLAWRHDAFGALTFPFDRVRGFRRSAPEGASNDFAIPDHTPSQDTLGLANGDALRGFLERLGDPVRFEVDGSVVEIDFSLVKGAALSNPPVAPSQLRVWLADGTVAQVEKLELDPRKRLVMTLSDGQSGAVDWEDVRAVLFDAARLIPLAAAPIRSQSATGGRRFAAAVERVWHASEHGMTPALDAWDLELPGPMAVEFELPSGAARLAMGIELANARSMWGDCEVSIFLDGRPAYKKRLWSDDRGADITIDLGGASIMKLVVEAGRYGPIGDRVALRRPLVLVAQ